MQTIIFNVILLAIQGIVFPVIVHGLITRFFDND